MAAEKCGASCLKRQMGPHALLSTASSNAVRPNLFATHGEAP
eukprot:CAMPEP_0202343378 /NCGR_PEP_ID=MMETSP1126-20121109/3523_1 /ASSEMBLY_ACC=CAM_ASM_000457 /TAXON_ID=3047 /ORGANISM="Dunaliella tertiolecta, Strain CCMP1320" /LENGTH=41 /DNA_ID= /DNA_START= /DNA_END= /DNA_ORIENTATION=